MVNFNFFSKVSLGSVTQSENVCLFTNFLSDRWSKINLENSNNMFHEKRMYDEKVMEKRDEKKRIFWISFTIQTMKWMAHIFWFSFLVQFELLVSLANWPNFRYGTLDTTGQKPVLNQVLHRRVWIKWVNYQ